MSSVRATELGVVLPCPACQANNRIPYDKLSEKATCGKCKADVPAPHAPLEVESEAAFAGLIAQSALPVILDYWAPWCPPCRAVAPEFDKVAETTAGTYIVAKVNTEALPGLGAAQRVGSIPTMAVFDEGKEVARTVGARPASDILAFVRQSLSSRR